MLAASGVYAGITSNFDSDLDGWVLVDANGATAQGQLEWYATGGNPDGYANFIDEGSDGGFISAPSIYLGDWTQYSGVLTISYEHRIISEGTVEQRVPYEIRIQGPGGEAQFLGDIPLPPSGWYQVEAPLESSVWTILSGDWLGILADITAFRIRIEQTDGHVDVSGIDNISFPSETGISENDLPDNGSAFLVNGSFPNPFDSEAQIYFENNPNLGMTVEVFDLRGRLVSSHNNDYAPEGAGVIALYGNNARGAKLSAGQYFVRLTSGSVSTVCKVVVMR